MANLPPLTEKIDRGAAGGHEFERLMHRLLIRDGQTNGYTYLPTSGPNGDWCGVDGVVKRGKFLGLPAPTGLQFKWLWGTPTLNSTQRSQIADALSSALRNFPRLKAWVIVTPL